MTKLCFSGKIPGSIVLAYLIIAADAAVIKRQVFPGLDGVTSAASSGFQIQRAQTKIKGGFGIPGVDDNGNPTLTQVGGDFTAGKSPIGYNYDHLFGKTGDDGGPKSAFGGLDTEILTGRKNQIAGNIGFPVGKDSNGRPIQSGFAGDLETGKDDPRIKYNHGFNRVPFGNQVQSADPNQQIRPSLFGPSGGSGQSASGPLLYGPASGQWGSSSQGSGSAPLSQQPPPSNQEYRYPPGCDPNDPTTFEACKPPPGTDPKVIYVYPVPDTVFDKMVRESIDPTSGRITNDDKIDSLKRVANPSLNAQDSEASSTIEPLENLPGIEKGRFEMPTTTTATRTRKPRKKSTQPPETTEFMSTEAPMTEATDSSTPEIQESFNPIILNVGSGAMLSAQDFTALGMR